MVSTQTLPSSAEYPNLSLFGYLCALVSLFSSQVLSKQQLKNAIFRDVHLHEPQYIVHAETETGMENTIFGVYIIIFIFVS